MIPVLRGSRVATKPNAANAMPSQNRFSFVSRFNHALRNLNKRKVTLRLIKIQIPRLVRVKNYNEYWHAMMFSVCRGITGILKFLSEIKEIHSVKFSKVVSKERIYTKLSLFKSINFSKRGFAISRRR